MTARPLIVDEQDRADLIDALQDAGDDLTYRIDNHQDYGPEDLPAIDAKIARWEKLIERIVALSEGRH